MNANVFDEFAKALDRLLPPGVADVRADVQKNARAALQSALTNLDLVTREEFDVQAKVLGRTREKLETLEDRVAKLEEQIRSVDDLSN